MTVKRWLRETKSVVNLERCTTGLRRLLQTYLAFILTSIQLPRCRRYFDRCRCTIHLALRDAMPHVIFNEYILMPFYSYYSSYITSYNYLNNNDPIQFRAAYMIADTMYAAAIKLWYICALIWNCILLSASLLVWSVLKNSIGLLSCR